MANTMRVKPKHDHVPPHPIDGKLPPEGGPWTADQYTFRLIRDGDIEPLEEFRGAAEKPAEDKSKAQK